MYSTFDNLHIALTSWGGNGFLLWFLRRISNGKERFLVLGK